MNKSRFFILLILFSFVLSFEGVAQSNGKDLMEDMEEAIADVKLEKVTIIGNQRYSDETILAYSELKKGSVVNSKTLDDAIKKVYKTGFFSDVASRFEDDVLIIKVVEKPVIKQVAFEGNKNVEDSTLSIEAAIYPRDLFSVTSVKKAVDRILETYQRSGYYNVSVSPQVIELEQNKVNVVFEIDEGRYVGVHKIVFLGNKNYTDTELKSVISTSETTWLSFLFGADQYDPGRVEYDKELLKRFYQNQGYIDFKIKKAYAELGPKKDGFYITYSVDEGTRYKVGTIKATSSLKKIKKDELTAVVKTQKGDWYSVKDVEASSAAIEEYLGQRGFAFVEVSPKVKRDRKNGTLDLTYQVKKSKRVTVNRINVVGNVRTVDKVIRREMNIIEGDAFDRDKLRQSKRNIQNLGYFSNVAVQPMKTKSPDKVDVKVNVAEKSTGELSFGVGFSTVDDFLTDLSLRENNLFGLGKRLAFTTSLSGRKQEFDVRFTEPYFLDRNMSAGFDLFKVTRDNQDESSHDEKRDGFALRLGYDLNDNLSQSWTYSYKTTKITDVDPSASRFIKDQEGERAVSSISQTLMYDKRDNRIEPKEGYMIRWTIDAAGIGGDDEFLRNRLAVSHYTPFEGGYVLGLYGDFGYIEAFNDEDISIAERFFMGGNSFRGFDVSGVGPRDITTNDALGGNTMYKVGAELAVPFEFAGDDSFSGRIFAEAGSLNDVDSTGVEVADDSSIRSTIGVGVVWRSPFGPLRVDLAKAINKEDYDEDEVFRFSIGTRF